MNGSAAPTTKPSILTFLEQIAESQQTIAAALVTLAAATEAGNPAAGRAAPAKRPKNAAGKNDAMAAIFGGATTFAEISKITGIPASTLRGWSDVRDALDRITGRPPAGHKSKTGDVESW